MQLTITIAALIVSLVTALFVYMKNPRGGTHVYFGMLIFFISLYPVFNYLAVTAGSNEEALLWAKFILFVSIPQGPLLLFFAKTFPSSKFTFNTLLQFFIIAWVLLNITLGFFGLIFESVAVHNGSVEVNPGPLVFSFGLLHVTSIVAGLSVLHGKYRKSIGEGRQQLSLIFYGFLVSFSITFLVTFVLPILLNNAILLAISPVFLALSVIIVAYAIVAKHLFDIRSTVARSVAYVLLVGTMALIYTVALFGFINVVFPGADNELARQLLPILLIVPLAVSFQSMKQFFDKVTDRIFFRQDYDLDQALNHIGDVTSDTIDLKQLAEDAERALQSTLRPNYILLLVLPRNRTEKPIYFSNSDNAEISSIKHNLNDFVKLLEHNTRKGKDRNIYIKNAMRENSSAWKLMNDHGADIVVRMKTNRELIGYMLIGQKQNGSLYTAKDIQLLNTASNELALAIQNALRFEEIRSFNRTLQEKVDQATAKLRRSNTRLRELDDAKDEFVSMASHQLRTPLTSVKGYLSMVLEGDSGELKKEQRKLLEEAYAGSQRMVYLIGDFLNVSRIKTGKFMLEYTQSNLANVIGDEVGQLRATAEGRNLNFIYEAPSSFPAVRLDENKIRQVAMNLIDNAIYYSKAGGTIKVELYTKDDQIVFRVRDDGIGVPAKEQKNLFEKFYRAENARKVRPDGTGLGLYMIKKVVVAHGGSIMFESKEGKGSTFGFTLPIKKTVSQKKKS